MHWIIVGILISIGIAIAPTVIAMALYSLPFIIGAFLGCLIGASISPDGFGLFFGGLVGGILPYIIYARINA